MLNIAAMASSLITPLLLVAAFALVTIAPAHAKAPPSAFGTDYDNREAVQPRPGDVDDGPGVAGERPSKPPRKLQRPSPRKRARIRLDGSQGSRRDNLDGSIDY